MTIRERITSIRPAVILLIGWSVFAIYAFPGLLTADSFAQLDDARSGVFRDINPPLMAALWWAIDKVIAGPFPMLVLQSVTLVAGVHLIARRFVRERAAAICAVAVLLAPPVLAVESVIWTHSLFAGLALLGTGLVIDPRPRVRNAGIAVLALAGGLRDSAPVATLPLVVLVVGDQLGWEAWRRYGIAFAIWLGCTLAVCGANAALVDEHWPSLLPAVDVAGTLAKADDLDPAHVRDLLDNADLVERDPQAYARAHYEAASGWGLALFALRAPMSDAQARTLVHARRTLIREQPGAYLRHRLDTYAVVLGLSGDAWSKKLVVTHDYQEPQLLAKANVPRGYTKLQGWIGEALDMLAKTPLFRPWLYVLLAIALVVAFRRDAVLRGLLASGLALELSLVYNAGAPDFRESHWLATTALVAAAIAIARRFSRR
ncbi:MAG TPA: hypothetical protein VFQ53_37900 [Kofleriaceae bacterium]|nr:hypothetical protein [Kofleriaceae bacterium]